MRLAVNPRSQRSAGEIRECRPLKAARPGARARCRVCGSPARHRSSFRGCNGGDPRAVWTRVGVAQDLAVSCRNEIRKTSFGKGAKTIRHFPLARRFDLERCGSVFHRMGVDRRDGGDVGCGRRPDNWADHDLPMTRAGSPSAGKRQVSGKRQYQIKRRHCTCRADRRLPPPHRLVRRGSQQRHSWPRQARPQIIQLDWKSAATGDRP
jgi:hypothetical protein